MATIIRSQTSLLKNYKIDISYQECLSATVSQLNNKGEVTQCIAHLPVRARDPSMAFPQNIKSLEKLFAFSSLVAERGRSGLYDRVSVYFGLNGGGKTQIPFQPGLALGSIVRSNTLDQMEAYDETASEIQALKEQIESAEQEIEVLDAKIKAKTGKLSSKADVSEDPSIVRWKNDQIRIRNWMDKLTKKLEESEKKEIPIFSGFSQGLESPINFEGSGMKTQERGFDSLSYSSQYISLSEEGNLAYDKIEHVFKALDANVGGGWGPLKVKASYSGSKATSDRLTQLKHEGITQGVLVVHATLTTRFVRCFTNLTYDLQKLDKLLFAMESTNEAEQRRYGISKISTNDNKNSELAVYLLTEAVLGGSFTSLVYILNEKTTKQSKISEEKTSGHKGSIEIGAKVGALQAHIEGNYTDIRDSENRSDDLNKFVSTKVKVEIFSQGALPSFSYSVDASSDEQTHLAAASKSVASAYTDFIKKINETGAGIPIGFNYQILTKSMIEVLVKKK